MGAAFMKKKTDYSSKPYNRCLSCSHRSVRCDGPRTSAMDLARWCEFMRDMKEVNGLTNAYIAEKSGVSIKTIERLMAQNIEQDIMRETARRIEDAIIGSSNQYPCILAFEESAPENTKKLNDALRDLERALDDNKDYRAMLDKIQASYNAEMQFMREDAQKKITFLVSQVEQLRRDNDNLWAENNRKSKIVDMFLAKQDYSEKQK
jgi:transcriptional regulator with XRE-family HTH domain